MAYTLILAEKPAAAERIAKALADGKVEVVKKNGTRYFKFKRNGKEHICVPAVGHLFVLDTKDKKWKYPVFDVEWIETFKRRGSAFTKKYYENIRELAKNADEIISATDYDTEGEVISYNILRFIFNVNDAKRMKFSTLTKDELVKAYENLLPHIDFGQAEAGLTRHYLDFFWGINLTRALTLAMRSNSNRGFNIISSGRVQSPTLAMLLEREREIRAFKPTPFWQLQIHCMHDGKTFVAMHEKDKIWEKEVALEIFNKCKGRDAVVKEINKKRYKQLPPHPFNTTDLQTEAYNQFKFSPQQTLSIAENLYQQGYISYPRSSSQKLPPTINYRKILKAISQIPEYKPYCEMLLKLPELKPREGPKEDPAHPAVYATQEVPNLKKLSPQERKLYDLIVRRTLATFAPPAIRESMKVILTVNNENFVVVGKRTIEEGWIKIYGPYVKYDEQILPELKVGSVVKIVKIEMLEKETQPPARYTQGSIIKEMEKNGLGTKATRAQILQTLYDRGYIEGKSIRVTPLGETVVNILEKYSPRIISVELTRHFENEMELVFNGKKKREEVVEEAKKVLTEILENFKVNQNAIGEQLTEAYIQHKRKSKYIGKCPKCGKDLKIIVSRKSGKRFVGCTGWKDGCDFAMPLPQFGQIIPLGKECSHCGMPMIMVKRKGKRPFTMCININCPSKKEWKNKKQ
ncbi:MAG: DNA topoisomerase I [Candidatus Aenigmarchaeota archaeon]|nr:DNA topoisomerase I [Candidatus Aenigmarchaeota archaeon]